MIAVGLGGRGIRDEIWSFIALVVSLVRVLARRKRVKSNN
jgi:hypothetical protein